MVLQQVSWELLEGKDWILFIFTSPAPSTVMDNDRLQEM